MEPRPQAQVLRALPTQWGATGRGHGGQWVLEGTAGVGNAEGGALEGLQPSPLQFLAVRSPPHPRTPAGWGRRLGHPPSVPAQCHPPISPHSQSPHSKWLVCAPASCQAMAWGTRLLHAVGFLSPVGRPVHRVGERGAEPGPSQHPLLGSRGEGAGLP